MKEHTNKLEMICRKHILYTFLVYVYSVHDSFKFSYTFSVNFDTNIELSGKRLYIKTIECIFTIKFYTFITQLLCMIKMSSQVSSICLFS